MKYFYLAHFRDEAHTQPLGIKWNRENTNICQLKGAEAETEEEVESLADFSRWPTGISQHRKKVVVSIPDNIIKALS
jgi:hypothetical protein